MRDRAAQIVEPMAATQDEILHLRAAATPEAPARPSEFAQLPRTLNRLSHELHHPPAQRTDHKDTTQ
jgi:hypothetical protein